MYWKTAASLEIQLQEKIEPYKLHGIEEIKMNYNGETVIQEIDLV